MNGFRTLAMAILVLLLNGQAVAAVLSPLDSKPEETASMALSQHGSSMASEDCHEAGENPGQKDHCQSRCGCCFSTGSHVPLLLAQARLPDDRSSAFRPAPGVWALPGPERERLLRPPIAHPGI